MTNCNCNCSCRCKCAIVGLILGAILGVIAAFSLITGALTIPTAFLWAALGLGAVYLGLLLLRCCGCRCELGCLCANLNVLLLGILGTILTAAILLAFGITATSVVSAVLVGLLVLSITVTFTGAACYVRSVAGCGE